jgi:glucose/mannose transport system permease protein
MTIFKLNSQFWSRLLLLPAILATLVFVYAFILWTVGISFTPSSLVPRWEWNGFAQYLRLIQQERFQVSMSNLLLFCAFSVPLTGLLGLGLAILLDQKIRAEGLFRTIYLYPMALSFIVTGTAWKWLLNPEIGIQAIVRDLGWSGFEFDWMSNPERALYCVVIASIWQSTGFAMALFLAGIRAIDAQVISAARIDGAKSWTLYRRVVLPMLRPVFLSVGVILANSAIKTFDLVLALTGGGPGFSSDLPALYMVVHAFQRSQLGLAAASATVIFVLLMLVLIPHLRRELRSLSGGTR